MLGRSCIAVLLVAAACSGDDASVADATTTTTTGGSTDTTTSSGANTTSSTTSSADSESGMPMPDVGVPESPPWDPDPPPPPCAVNEASALLDDALAAVELDRASLRFTDDDFAESTQYQAGVIGGDFALSHVIELRADPATIGCFEGEVAGGFDHALSQAHPVASAIRHAARLVDRPPDDALPLAPADFDAEIAALCDMLGGCGEPEGELTDALRSALGPIVAAAREAIAARLAMDAEPGGDPVFWQDDGGNLIHIAAGPPPSPSDEDVRAYMLGMGARARLYRAAAQLAFAIEDANLGALRVRSGVAYRLVTPAGVIEVADDGPTMYPADSPEVLLRLDLGGDDIYRDEVAANRSASNPVSVAIDLGGADDYGYDAVATPYDRPELLPADDAGRAAAGGGYGNYTQSQHFRQGAARNGVALLFDLGDDDDRYASLRGSQGYAHLGVGVLFDAGGDDVYDVEASGQGAAVFGIGLAIDASGNDRRRAFTQSQGFAFAGGLGALVDVEGDDEYLCDVGDPAEGGLVVYYSPQMPDDGNTSMCQGAGYGDRDDNSRISSLAGGLGVLRDREGDDAYDASVFAQGTGYWEGIGLLADGDGTDRYDARWYVQGGAAHYAVGVLADGGTGDDRFGTSLVQRNVSMGSGHDFSIGALVSAGGSDEYVAPSLALGASNCNGIGLFVDTAGDDVYTLTSDLAAGLGNISGECLAARPDARSIGVMLDGGGLDSYTPPGGAVPEFVAPSDGGMWGYARAGLPSERGTGLDGRGATGIRVESAARR